MNAQAIAEETLRQLGGNRFLVMTGARYLAYHENGALQFRLPGRIARQGINHVRVELNGMDLYDITFASLRGMKHTVKHEATNVHAESLRDIFTTHTGLHCTL